MDFGKSRDRKEYPSQTKPNIYRNGFENFRIVESQIRERYGAGRLYKHHLGPEFLLFLILPFLALIIIRRSFLYEV